jgi:hypothetical protein
MYLIKIQEGSNMQETLSAPTINTFDRTGNIDLKDLFAFEYSNKHLNLIYVRSGEKKKNISIPMTPEQYQQFTQDLTEYSKRVKRQETNLDRRAMRMVTALAATAREN